MEAGLCKQREKMVCRFSLATCFLTFLCVKRHFLPSSQPHSVNSRPRQAGPGSVHPPPRPSSPPGRVQEPRRKCLSRRHTCAQTPGSPRNGCSGATGGEPQLRGGGVFGWGGAAGLHLCMSRPVLTSVFAQLRGGKRPENSHREGLQKFAHQKDTSWRRACSATRTGAAAKASPALGRRTPGGTGEGSVEISARTRWTLLLQRGRGGPTPGQPAFRGTSLCRGRCRHSGLWTRQNPGFTPSGNLSCMRRGDRLSQNLFPQATQGDTQCPPQTDGGFAAPLPTRAPGPSLQ